MSSNFEFLKAEWPDLYEAAVNAEKHTFIDPRTCAFYSRYALERTVLWLYDHDSSLKRPYQEKLAALLHEETFTRNLGTGLFNRVRYIHQLGNHAAHSSGRIREHESLTSLRHLFALLCWLTRTYSKNPPRDILFKESSIPKTGQAEKTTQQIKQLQEELTQKDRQLEEERRKWARQKKEYEKLLGQIQEIKEYNQAALPPEDYSEEETRDLFIDLMLREAGWDLDGAGVTTEYKITGMPGKSGTGYADYVLWGDDGLPLAVIEAKRSKRSPQDGEHQAKLYADNLEKMKGQRPVIFYTNGYETWLWDDTFYPPRPVQGFYTKDQLQYMINRRKTRKPPETIPIDNSIVDRGYHVEGLRRVSEDFSKGRRKALVVMATGAGKTQFAIALVKILMQANWVRRVLFLADRITLVRQAKNRFNELYPDASTVNLLEEKENDRSRVVFSTYPTMMNSIDETRGKDRKRFGVGHFDLIIIDEAHRSIYLKYKALFDYFDAMLLGLTATPKAEVDRNTYRLFDLETHMPTFYYELEEAVRAGYLVPPRAMAVPLKFPQEGIRYHELSEEEKEEYEAKFYDEETGTMPEVIEPPAINEWLFNADTVDKVLAHLMGYGLKVQGGDRLGKTIIFAKNHRHALFIKERFDKIFPVYKGTFMQVIDHFTDYAHDRIDHFAAADKDPVIAVSVDMLDTGIDIHEIVNLVFFKIVRSRAKFWQMIGRGTRTCENLFGPGKDKKYFIIFDFCDNFAYFDEHPEGISPTSVEPLSQKIFKNRLFLAHYLRDTRYQENESTRRLYGLLLDILHRGIKELDPQRFFVRPHRKYVEKYSRREQWDQLEMTDVSNIVEQLSQLMTPADNDEIARRFDLLILNLQLSIVENTRIRQPLMSQLQRLAAALENLGSVPAVMARMKRIREIRTERFRENPSLMELEEVRQELRDLIKFIEWEKQKHVYTDFEDTIGESVEVEGIIRPEENMNDYRRKMEKYIRDNENHMTIIKLKTNKPITALDLEELERLLFEDCQLGTREDFERAYGTDRPLGQFIRSIVGLDRKAVKEAFSGFISKPGFSADQITFINQILEYLSRNGYMEKGALLEQPFTDIHYQGPYGIFTGDQVVNIISIIDTINNNAVGL